MNTIADFYKALDTATDAAIAAFATIARLLGETDDVIEVGDIQTALRISALYATAADIAWEVENTINFDIGNGRHHCIARSTALAQMAIAGLTEFNRI